MLNGARQVVIPIHFVDRLKPVTIELVLGGLNLISLDWNKVDTLLHSWFNVGKIELTPETSILPIFSIREIRLRLTIIGHKKKMWLCIN